MPKITLTDLAIQRLKAEDSQVRYLDSSTPGFGILVGKKAKTFFVVTGKERRMQTLGAYGPTSLKDARSEAKRILADPTARKASQTYQEAVKRFLVAREGHVKPATLKVYKFYLELMDFKGNLEEITRADIKEKLLIYKDKKRAQNACFAALKTFFNWAVEEELTTKQPIYKARMPNHTPSRSRVLTDAELVAIWNASTVPPYGNIIRLLVLTCARKMEVRNLVANGDYITFKDTKNKTDHTLPITPLIRQHLLPETYKFNNWQKAKELLNRESNVKSFTIHDLRRTGATNLIRLGVSSDVVEAVLNHKKTGIKEVYQRWNYAPQIQEALLTLEAHIVNITTARVQPEPSTAPLSGVRDETVVEKASD